MRETASTLQPYRSFAEAQLLHLVERPEDIRENQTSLHARLQRRLGEGALTRGEVHDLTLGHNAGMALYERRLGA